MIFLKASSIGIGRFGKIVRERCESEEKVRHALEVRG